MPRVLRIHNRLVIGGLTVNILSLVKHLQPDFETLFVIGQKEPHEEDASYIASQMGVVPVVIPEMQRTINLRKDYLTFRKIYQIIKDFKPDIVHTHTSKPGIIGRLAASVLKVPVIIHTYEGHVFHSYFSKAKSAAILQIERAMGNKTTAIVAVSPEQKKELSQQFKVVNGSKIHIVPMGFDLQKFSEGKEQKRQIFRDEFNLKDDEIALGIIGRLVPIKNHELFIEAVGHVLKKSSKKIKAFIIGDGETRMALESTARDLGIAFSAVGDSYDEQKPLVFTSWRTDMDAIIAGLDIICLSSFNEGTPVSLIEAQAANKPIVSTNVGGVEFTVKNGGTALLSNINSKIDYCNNMLSLVDDDALRQSLGQNGSEWVMGRFSIERQAKDLRKLYYELLEKSK